ncbi:MAG: purine-nucleoside phosphorylase [Actinobacteria bacterium]|nr:purine-nucleoside phosphorylase [Actinomycetota bacterium]
MSHIVPAIQRGPTQPIHLRPAVELAERVVLPGDPGRALAIAQAHLGSPRMFNTRRGLWGYTGRTEGGVHVTVQSTGMGGPSAAIVVEELIALGARVLVRAGTCGAIDPALSLGDLVTAGAALATDGTSRALGAGQCVAADAELTSALVEVGGGRAITVASTDLFYEDADGHGETRGAAGAAAVEMEAAAVMQVAARRGVRAGCVLLVSDVLDAGGRRRLDDEALEEGGLALGEVALAALEADAAKRGTTTR